MEQMMVGVAQRETEKVEERLDVSDTLLTAYTIQYNTIQYNKIQQQQQRFSFSFNKIVLFV